MFEGQAIRVQRMTNQFAELCFDRREQSVNKFDALTIEELRSSALVEVVAVAPELVKEAEVLYRERHDKEWGLTDCISFKIMQQRQLLDALTCDEHFAQAAFRPLLLEDPQ